MKVYGWVPDYYGDWAYVLAESPEAAKEAMKLTTLNKPTSDWDYEYHKSRIDEWIKRDPDVSYGVGEVISGEVC
jgi:hypothetical protein